MSATRVKLVLAPVGTSVLCGPAPQVGRGLSDRACRPSLHPPTLPSLFPRCFARSAYLRLRSSPLRSVSVASPAAVHTPSPSPSPESRAADESRLVSDPKRPRAPFPASLAFYGVRVHRVLLRSGRSLASVPAAGNDERMWAPFVRRKIVVEEDEEEGGLRRLKTRTESSSSLAGLGTTEAGREYTTIPISLRD